VIFFVAPAEDLEGITEYLQQSGPALSQRLTAVTYDEIVARGRLSLGTYIFAAIDELTPVTGNLYFGVSFLGTGDYRRAESLLLEVLPWLEGDLCRERLGQAGYPAVMARFFLPWVLADLGKFKEGIVPAQEGVRLAMALDHPYSLACAYWALAYVQIVKGELSQAVGSAGHHGRRSSGDGPE